MLAILNQHDVMFDCHLQEFESGKTPEQINKVHLIREATTLDWRHQYYHYYVSLHRPFDVTSSSGRQKKRTGSPTDETALALTKRVRELKQCFTFTFRQIGNTTDCTPGRVIG